jgi:hypothetical protein
MKRRSGRRGIGRVTAGPSTWDAGRRMTSEDEGGTPRPAIGRSFKDRQQITHTSEDGSSGTGFDYEAHTVEDAYADHIEEYGVPVVQGGGKYPDQNPPQAPSDTAASDLLAQHPVNPDSAKKHLFIDLEAYEDPATGKPRPSSPVEVLRRDLERLEGAGTAKSLKVLLDLSELSERDLGAWQAAQDLLSTTTTAQTTLGGAINRVYSVYSAVVQALDDHVKAAKATDRSIADGMGKRA